MIVRTNRRMRLCTVLLIVNLAFIWGNSMLSGTVSGAISDWVKGILQMLFPGASSGSSGGGLLRKAAHFCEFACLGGLLTWLFGMLCKRPYFLAPICGAVCAGIDETIQRFSPGRCPSLWDVCLDTAGVLFGMFLLLAGYSIHKHHFLEETT